MTRQANYEVDSPRIAAALGVLGVVLMLVGHESSSTWRWVARAVGAYFLSGVLGMLFYSKVGKLALTERLLDRMQWRGNERALDVGCGCGLLTMAAAHRVIRGSVIGVDVWNRNL